MQTMPPSNQRLLYDMNPRARLETKFASLEHRFLHPFKETKYWNRYNQSLSH